VARCLLRRDAPVDRPSRVFGLRSEDQRRWLHTPSGLREPSASNPKVVSPTVAPRSLGPIFGRGAASTPWAPSAPRSATLRAGRRDGVRRSTVRVTLQKMLYFHRRSKDFRIEPLVCAQIIELKILGGEISL